MLVAGGVLVACTSSPKTDGAAVGTKVECHSGRPSPELVAKDLADAARAGDRRVLCELLPATWSIDDTTWELLTSRVPAAGELLLVESTQDRLGDLSSYSLLDETGGEVLRLRITCPLVDGASVCHVLLGTGGGGGDMPNGTSGVERPQKPRS